MHDLKWSVFRAGCAEIPGYYLCIESDVVSGFAGKSTSGRATAAAGQCSRQRTPWVARPTGRMLTETARRRLRWPPMPRSSRWLGPMVLLPCRSRLCCLLAPGSARAGLCWLDADLLAGPPECARLSARRRFSTRVSGHWGEPRRQRKRPAPSVAAAAGHLRQPIARGARPNPAATYLWAVRVTAGQDDGSSQGQQPSAPDDAQGTGGKSMSTLLPDAEGPALVSARKQAHAPSGARRVLHTGVCDRSPARTRARPARTDAPRSLLRRRAHGGAARGALPVGWAQ